MNPVPVNCSKAESVQHRVAVAVQESFCRSEIVRMCDSQASWAGEWPALLRQLCSPTCRGRAPLSPDIRVSRALRRR